MATECQLPCSDEDDKMLDEARERGVVVPEAFREVTPEMERAREERCIECLRENVDNARNEIRALEQSGVVLNELQKLDFMVRPTEEQCHIQYEVGIKLSKESREEGSEMRFPFSENAIVNFPTIYGTKGVETTPELVEEIMRTLCDFKMERKLWDVTSYDGIMLIDAQTADDFASELKGADGYVHLAEVLQESQRSPETISVKLDEKTAKEIGLTHVPEPGEFKAKEILPRILHIILDKDGRPTYTKAEQEKGREPTPEKPVPYGKVWTWALAHETHHLGYHQSYGVGPIDRRITDNKDEWERAKEAQMQKGPVAEYGFRPADPEDEFNTQCHAAWESDSPLLCPEMKEFFDKHLSE